VSPSATRVTTAQAVAYARAVNLRAGDVREMSSDYAEGEAPAPTSANFEFARCYGGVSPARRVLKIHSPEFSAGRGAHSQLVNSYVEVWPSAAVAARHSATYMSSRGRACLLRFQEESRRRTNKQRGGALHIGPYIVATVPNPLPGVSRSFLRTIAQPMVRGGHIRLYIYHDLFSFISGPAEIELQAIGFSRPVSAATEKRLLLLILSRAQAHKL